MSHKLSNKSQKAHRIDQELGQKSVHQDNHPMSKTTGKVNPVQLSARNNAHAAFSPRTTLDQGRGH